MTDWTAALCQHLGVHANYRGFEGQTVHVAHETCVGVLRAMGIDIASEKDSRERLQHMQSADALRPAPHEVIVQAAQSFAMPITHAVEWALRAEVTGQLLSSGQAAECIIIPPLPIGIHRLNMLTRSDEFTTWILCRPARAVMLEDRMAAPRIWGVLAALYGLTDGDAVGLGTYDLLGDYAAAMAWHGSDFLGINPIHAMGQVRPDDVISPYSPSHRGFLNTWHCAAAGKPCSAAPDLIDYDSALRESEHALSAQYAQFAQLPETAPDKLAFERFVTASGSALQEFTLFEALTTCFGPDWRHWPAPYRDHDADALSEFRHAHTDAIARSAWAQWLADRQLAQAESRAADAGMRIGLYLDLAVGPRLGGAETWVKDTSLVTGAALGAPPDQLSPTGQSWGLAPQSPLECRKQGYSGFARLLRAAMRHAGMIRIDHVLGLMRSFWIPDGSVEGTYVSYQFDALMAVVAIESVRSNTIVVGEDLGLVPEGLREKLAASGIYGLDVLQYMRTPTGGFADTSKARELAICAFGTHDTPTIAGFFAAEDARTRHQFGGIDTATFEQTRADRQFARETLCTSQPVHEIHGRLARARSSMVAIQLDDIAQRRSQQNLPGTVDEYPNWRLKAPFTVREVTTSEAFERLGSEMCAQNRSNLKKVEKTDAF